MKENTIRGVSRLLIAVLVFVLCFSLMGTDKVYAGTNGFEYSLTKTSRGWVNIKVTGFPKDKGTAIAVERSDGGKNNFVAVGSIAINDGKVSVKSDRTVPFGKTVYYRLCIVNSDKERTSGYSEIKSIGKDVKTPALSIADVSSPTKLTLKWNKIDGATGYKIYKYNIEKACYYYYTTVKDGSATSYTATGLKTGRRATFKIQSYQTKNGKTYYSTKSLKATAIPTLNQFVKSFSSDYRDYTPDKLSVKLKKVSYNSSNQLVVKLLVVNRTGKGVVKFNDIKVNLKHNGTLIASKTFSDKVLNLGNNKMTTIICTYSTKYKVQRNLRYGKFDYSASYHYTYKN